MNNPTFIVKSAFVMASALAASAAWGFPATPCAVATASCVTIKDAGINTDGTAVADQAIFQISGTTLTVTLSNTGAGDVTKPPDILTALFFTLKNSSGT